MNYSRDEFFDLIDLVEGQGGEHLEKLCKATKYTFSGKAGKPLTMPSCGNASIFKVPYEHLGPDGVESLRPVEVCAVDDDMGRWPRFGGDRFAGPEHYIEPTED